MYFVQIWYSQNNERVGQGFFYKYRLYDPFFQGISLETRVLCTLLNMEYGFGMGNVFRLFTPDEIKEQ